MMMMMMMMIKVEIRFRRILKVESINKNVESNRMSIVIRLALMSPTR